MTAIYFAARALMGEFSDEGRRNMLLVALVVGVLSMAMVLMFNHIGRDVGGKVRSLTGLGLDETVSSIREFMADRGLETKEVPPGENSSIKPGRSLEVGGGRLDLELHKVDESITYIYAGPLPRGEDQGLADLLTGLDQGSRRGRGRSTG